MSSLTEQSAWTTLVNKVENGEQIDQDLLNAAAQALANRTLWLKNLIEGHADNESNPHKVTTSQIGAETPTGAQAKVNTHENKTSTHGATSSATASRIILRDSAGRAKVAAPAASDDIARKDTVDSHASATSAHGATSAESASRIAMRDSSGDIHARLFRSSYSLATTACNFLMGQVDQDSNNFIRPMTPALVRSLLNVENGATADQSASEILALLKTVDSDTSGLNASYLRGRYPSASADAGTIAERDSYGRLEANSGVSGNDVAVMSQFGSYLNNSGYQKLPSGLIIQWGVFAWSSSSGNSVTFPVTYPNELFILFGNRVLVANDQNSLGTTSMSLSGFTMDAVAYGTYHWISIGR